MGFFVPMANESGSPDHRGSTSISGRSAASSAARDRRTGMTATRSNGSRTRWRSGVATRSPTSSRQSGSRPTSSVYARSWSTVVSASASSCWRSAGSSRRWSASTDAGCRRRTRSGLTGWRSPRSCNCVTATAWRNVYGPCRRCSTISVSSLNGDDDAACASPEVLGEHAESRRRTSTPSRLPRHLELQRCPAWPTAPSHRAHSRIVTATFSSCGGASADCDSASRGRCALRSSHPQELGTRLLPALRGASPVG